MKRGGIGREKEIERKKCPQHREEGFTKLPGARQRGRGIQCQQNYSFMPMVSNMRPISNKTRNICRTGVFELFLNLARYSGARAKIGHVLYC